MKAHEQALRSLDAAGPELITGRRERAGATLERILASDPSVAAGRYTPVRRRRRLVAAAAAGVALVAGAVVVAQNLGDDQAAYASWTATPTTVAGHELDAAVAACRDQLDGGSLDVHRARLVLAERRGDHVALLLRTDNPDVAGACLVHEPPGSTDVDDVHSGIAGSSGPSQRAPAAGFTEGSVFQFAGASIVEGAAGAQVTGVTVHAGAYTAHATLHAGRYVAWWPGPAFAGTAGPPGKDTMKEIVRFDLTLANGTVQHDAKPSRPK